MVSINLKSPCQVLEEIAVRARAQRLALNWTQKTLSARSGVPYGTIKKFEQTGKISLSALLELSIVLGRLEDFDAIFAPHQPLPKSLDDMIKAKPKSRQRGRT
jgi:transcriptional regulator with XRE-family HTH domain